MTSDTALRLGDGATPTESDPTQRLCELFATALELDAVTPDTDFFLAGGHSLSALTLAVAVEEAFGVRVRVRDVFDAATPELLASRLAGLVPGAVEPAGPAPARQRPDTGLPGAEVAEATRWLWLERQRGDGDSGAYTVPCLLDGEGAVDADRLAAALAGLARRHPALRTVFVEAQGEPRAVVTDDVLPLEVVDLRGHDAGDTRFDALVDERLAMPFDPSAGPLTRTTLFLRDDARWSLLLLADHLVCDGRSLEILATQLVAAYADPAAAVAPQDRPAHRSSGQEAALDHWRRVLLPPPAPLPLPVRGLRTEQAGCATGIAVQEIGPDLLRRLTQLGRRHHAGPFVPLAAAVARTLAAITGSSDICLGTPVDRRARLGADDAVGFHVATVPLRLEVRDGTSADDLVQQVAQRTMDAVDHSEVAFDTLVAALAPPRSPGRMPFFDVWVALYPRIDTGPCAPGGIALRGGPIPLRVGMFELSFQFVEHVDGMRLVLQYDTARYAADTAERMVRRLGDEVARLLGDPAEPGPEAAPAHRAFGGFRFDD
ncbi:condensation domain-containing protein [Streptomyces sp. KS 21]|uniref:condensation domain-containing protein n=1 Tax=Streptomyces sp. KS 21 TaxID=2485150 RepID=UPI0010F073A9|nr:condensation domain-containing protein [Streptomyces sp. KS 21]TDU79551.1 phosphopantetheine binding protein [Streptomyces sp. KS 21]